MSENTAPETTEAAETAEKSPAFVPDETRFVIEGRDLVWTDLDGETIAVPLRMPLSLIRKVKNANLDDPETMIDIILALVPGLDEDRVDFADFQHLFVTWQHIYNERAAAALGESSR